METKTLTIYVTDPITGRRREWFHDSRSLSIPDAQRVVEFIIRHFGSEWKPSLSAHNNNRYVSVAVGGKGE
jgi:hypothetical protein